jgi:hypothetical protein
MKALKQTMIGLALSAAMGVQGCAEVDGLENEGESEASEIGTTQHALQYSASATPSAQGGVGFADAAAKIWITSNNEAQFYFIRMSAAPMTVRGVSVSLLCTLGSFRQVTVVNFGDMYVPGWSGVKVAKCKGGAISRATLTFNSDLFQ